MGWFAEQIEARYGLRCITEVACAETASQRYSGSLTHAVRELLVNVAKHVWASTVKVIAGYEKDQIFVRVVDNGKGLVPPTASSPGRRADLALRSSELGSD